MCQEGELVFLDDTDFDINCRLLNIVSLSDRDPARRCNDGNSLCILQHEFNPNFSGFWYGYDTTSILAIS